jgi:hypothetical protein
VPNASQIALASTAASRFRSGLTGEVASLSSSRSGENRLKAEELLIRKLSHPQFILKGSKT